MLPGNVAVSVSATVEKWPALMGHGLQSFIGRDNHHTLVFHSQDAQQLNGLRPVKGLTSILEGLKTPPPPSRCLSFHRSYLYTVFLNFKILSSTIISLLQTQQFMTSQIRSRTAYLTPTNAFSHSNLTKKASIIATL